eukprot:6932767-Lingulodinium_polyedra.AAC.1
MPWGMRARPSCFRSSLVLRQRAARMPETVFPNGFLALGPSRGGGYGPGPAVRFFRARSLARKRERRYPEAFQQAGDARLTAEPASPEA